MDIEGAFDYASFQILSDVTRELSPGKRKVGIHHCSLMSSSIRLLRRVEHHLLARKHNYFNVEKQSKSRRIFKLLSTLIPVPYHGDFLTIFHKRKFEIWF